jgi:hypothetical protein
MVSFIPLPLYPPGEITAGTPCIGAWVVPRAGLDDVEKRKFLTTTSKPPQMNSSGTQPSLALQGVMRSERQANHFGLECPPPPEFFFVFAKI